MQRTALSSLQIGSFQKGAAIPMIHMEKLGMAERKGLVQGDTD